MVWQKITGPADTLKPGARGAVKVLHAMSLDVGMIARDNAYTAAAIALYPSFGISLNPMLAGAAMAFSSVSVVTNSLRLRRFIG